MPNQLPDFCEWPTDRQVEVYTVDETLVDTFNGDRQVRERRTRKPRIKADEAIQEVVVAMATRMGCKLYWSWSDQYNLRMAYPGAGDWFKGGSV